MVVIPETPFSGGVPPELTHRVVAVPAFNIIEYYPNEAKNYKSLSEKTKSHDSQNTFFRGSK